MYSEGVHIANLTYMRFAIIPGQLRAPLVQGMCCVCERDRDGIVRVKTLLVTLTSFDDSLSVLLFQGALFTTPGSENVLYKFLSQWTMGINQTVQLKGPIQVDSNADFLLNVVDMVQYFFSARTQRCPIQQGQRDNTTSSLCCLILCTGGHSGGLS